MIELTSYKLAQFDASYLKDTNREQNDDIETTKGIQEIESFGIQDAGNPNEDRKKKKKKKRNPIPYCSKVVEETWVQLARSKKRSFFSS